MRRRRTAAILGLCVAAAAPLPVAALEAGHVSSPPAAARQVSSPSPLAVLMWRWNVHRLLATAATPVALRAPEPARRELRIASRVEPRVRARLAALQRAPATAVRRQGPVRPDHGAGAPTDVPEPRREGPVPRLDLPPFLAAASPAAEGPVVEAPPDRGGETSGLLYAAAALAHGRIETGDDTWKLGVSVSHDLDEFKLRLGYRFPAR